MNLISSLMGRLAIPALALTMGTLGAYHVHRESQSPGASEPPASPSTSPYDEAIAVAGLVEARSENIAVGSALSGVVLEVFVSGDRVGATVAAGDPLFRVDDRHLRAERAAAQARLDAAAARLDRLRISPRPEEIPPSLAQIETAEGRVALALDKLERARRLVGRDAVSTERLVERELEYRIACAELDRVRGEHALLIAGAWEADLSVLEAEQAQAAAEVARLEVEIDRATVRAPINGTVLRVSVRPGEQVAALPDAPLVVLGDLSAVFVRAEVDEEEIPRLRPGAPARAFTRGDGQNPRPLRFVRVEPLVLPKRSLTGLGGERVDTRVLEVLFEVEDPHSTPLFVGQQMDVFIDTRPSPTLASDDPRRESE
ncbi:HlyD family secretion protein [Tautonia rosea]|uniref:HlyD family secretion protein n=1 Tax=Tautonia rosea TaxID=2728037 RepID=UPI001474805C|nr:HlyD family efflux transporter periplasmic adaptor subunit [Tautonia rosea]